MRLRLTRRATCDLATIADYIREQNPTASIRVRNAMQAAFQVIAQHPRAGRRMEHGLRRFTLPRFPYLIFYRVDDAAGAVTVMTIRHAAREIEGT